MPEKNPTLEAAGLRFGRVAARFNGSIVERLLTGAREALLARGAMEKDLRIVRVPGAWEIPAALSALAETGGVDALVAIGAVIRGETPHFDYICNECAAGCAGVTERTGIPVGFGLLTCDDEEQAAARAGGAAGNKGQEAALEMANLLRSLKP